MANAKSIKRTRAVSTFAETITVPKDGIDIHVPTTPEANKQLNCLLVSQMRHMMHENLRKIKDMEQPITPREMKDLIDGMAALVKSSRDAYDTLESLADPAPKTVTPSEEEAVALDADFSKLNTNGKPEHPTQPATQPIAQPGAPDGGQGVDRGGP